MSGRSTPPGINFGLDPAISANNIDFFVNSRDLLESTKQSILSVFIHAQTNSHRFHDAYTSFLGTGKELYIAYQYDEALFVGDFYGVRMNQVLIDPNLAVNSAYLDSKGNAIQVTLDNLVIHELIHAFTGLHDSPRNKPEFSGDFLGPNQKLVNLVYEDLDIAERVSYSGFNTNDLLQVGRNYTNGNEIDVAIADELPESYNTEIWEGANGTSDLFVDGSRHQSFTSGKGRDYIYAGGGNDVITAGSGEDLALGEAGNDLISGGDDDDTLDGGDGKDDLEGGEHDDSLIGGGGPDLLMGGAGEDSLFGDAGRDYGFGTQSRALLGSSDELRGDAGDDLLIGGSGRDELYGGDDVLATLADLFAERGPLEHIRLDNGPAFTANVVRDWLGCLGVKTAFITPGSPWENGYNESFNDKLRDELLDR